VAGEHQRAATEPRAIERGGQPGDAAAGDDDVEVLFDGLKVTQDAG
jgi:hypothetical protein